MFGDRSGCAKNIKSSMASPASEIHDIMASGYGYIKNHKKTVKNGQTRTRERKNVQEPEAKVNPQSKSTLEDKDPKVTNLVPQVSNVTQLSKSKGKYKLKGGKDNSRALQQNGKDKVVISKDLISSPSSKATWKMGKHNGMIGFTLESLTDQTQMPHNGLPRWQSV
ncbi:hypothetical protein Tco_0995189 [Tanacetum coccineum]